MATSVMQPKEDDNRTYTYSSQPRAVPQRKKYRDQQVYSNIMHDRRIVRGNTYALHALPASTQPDPLELQRQQETQRRAMARKRAREGLRTRSPEPLEGRKHIDVQTELYLEEITDRIEEADVSTQTDAFLDRPPTPLFIPAKTGMDVATQIEEGDLFDFDLEVRPILEVLVGKTVEQALLEVMEEEELASLRAQQRQFQENRNSELVETQRLEEQERRHREEKERRMQQQREALLKEKETAEKVAARAFAQSYLSDLVTSVFGTLNENGFFFDPVEREVETEFMPWLLDEAVKSMDKELLARTMLDAIIRDVVMKLLGISPPEPTPTPPSEAPPSAIEQTGSTEDEKPPAAPVEADPQPSDEQATSKETDKPSESDAVPPPAKEDAPPADGETENKDEEETPPNKEVDMSAGPEEGTEKGPEVGEGDQLPEPKKDEQQVDEEETVGPPPEAEPQQDEGDGGKDDEQTKDEQSS